MKLSVAKNQIGGSKKNGCRLIKNINGASWKMIGSLLANDCRFRNFILFSCLSQPCLI
jgi:hypothetical protein